MKTIPEQGFTLVELVASVAIFLIVIVGVAYSISSILSTHSRDFERTQALMLGKEKALEYNQSGFNFTAHDGEEGPRILSQNPLITYTIESLYTSESPYPIKETEYIRNVVVVHYSEGRIKFDF